MNRRKVTFPSRGSRAAHGSDVGHPRTLQSHENKLDEGMTRQFLESTQHRPSGRLAVPFDGGDDVLFQARELATHGPVRQSDPAAAGEAETWALPVRGS